MKCRGPRHLLAENQRGSGRKHRTAQLHQHGLRWQRQPEAEFSVSTGGAYLNQSSTVGAAGLQLDYALLDFARTPRVQEALAVLERERQVYGNQLRLLQLSISKDYYQLQQADQNVSIQDAAVPRCPADPAGLPRPEIGGPRAPRGRPAPPLH